MVKVTSLLIKPESALAWAQFWSQSSDRNEDMVHYRHVYAEVSSEKNVGVN